MRKSHGRKKRREYELLKIMINALYGIGSISNLPLTFQRVWNRSLQSRAAFLCERRIAEPLVHPRGNTSKFLQESIFIVVLPILLVSSCSFLYPCKNIFVLQEKILHARAMEGSL